MQMDLLGMEVSQISKVFGPEYPWRSHSFGGIHYLETNTPTRNHDHSENYWLLLIATAAYDPFPEFVVLGDSLTQGLFVWIEMGIDPTQDVTKYAPPAAFWTAEGGKNNANFDGSIVATPPSTHG